jgi:hypothetical protein
MFVTPSLHVFHCDALSFVKACLSMSVVGRLIRDTSRDLQQLIRPVTARIRSNLKRTRQAQKRALNDPSARPFFRDHNPYGRVTPRRFLEEWLGILNSE